MQAADTLLSAPTLFMQAQDISSSIQQILLRQMDAWAKGDAAAFASDYTADATFVTVRGDLVEGRRGIEANHAFIFNGLYKGTKLRENVDVLLPLAPGVALAHVSVELSSVASFPPGVTPSGPGLLRTRFLLIFVEHEGNWRIRSAQNTIVVPQPLRG